jgi:hypothetical protein
MEALTAPLSAAFSTFIPTSPLRSARSTRNITLDGESGTSGKIALSEKCELRIEGMTCGACVEVRIIVSDFE